ncbi:Uncharacterised protein [Vibrio cholerae]|nr:Uncharacterised protein [Vibrio cholerae]CSA52989.1 Uncharacterised protein [Vibrio cholerae]CSA53827.1 Uncharacterised protein [Vibrio cholerae]CSA59103.1 Uncharacterised protein [Vibrio cholerae]CSC26520.1 Uncharacterised protein [Vibrio cholerae]
MRQGGEQLLLNIDGRTDLDCCWDHIITALSHVDMIVWTHRIAQLTRGEGGNHLIGVHIGAGA